MLWNNAILHFNNLVSYYGHTTVSIFAGIQPGSKYKFGDPKSWLMSGFISGYVAGVKTFGTH